MLASSALFVPAIAATG